jgi:hypothetical protein
LGAVVIYWGLLGARWWCVSRGFRFLVASAVPQKLTFKRDPVTSGSGLGRTAVVG